MRYNDKTCMQLYSKSQRHCKKIPSLNPCHDFPCLDVYVCKALSQSIKFIQHQTRDLTLTGCTHHHISVVPGEYTHLECLLYQITYILTQNTLEAVAGLQPIALQSAPSHVITKNNALMLSACMQ